MRILMIAPQPFFRPRGTPFSVLHRIRALARLGHSVELVTYPFGEPVGIPELVIRRTARPPGVRDVSVGPSVSKLLLDIPLFAEAFRAARRGGFDLLHTHEEAGAMGAWIARRCSLPHLYDMHSSLPQQFANFARYNYPPVVGLFRRLERYTLAGADGVIAICPELRDHVLSSGYDKPLALIENTLDFDPPDFTEADAESLKNRLGLEGKLTILYTGTLEAYQGLDLLLRAAPSVLRRVPHARLVIVGGTEDQIGRLEGEAQVAGVKEQVTFVPAVPPQDVFIYHRLADVLVTVRSKGTNTPLKIYQYLRAGRPIVATAIRSHTQVLNSDSAELVDPDPEQIAAGLLRVLTDSKHAARLAEGARRLALDRYSAESYLERLRDLLERIAKKSPPKTGS